MRCPNCPMAFNKMKRIYVSHSMVSKFNKKMTGYNAIGHICINCKNIVLDL